MHCAQQSTVEQPRPHACSDTVTHRHRQHNGTVTHDSANRQARKPSNAQRCNMLHSCMQTGTSEQTTKHCNMRTQKLFPPLTDLHSSKSRVPTSSTSSGRTHSQLRLQSSTQMSKLRQAVMCSLYSTRRSMRDCLCSIPSQYSPQLSCPAFLLVSQPSWQRI